MYNPRITELVRKELFKNGSATLPLQGNSMSPTYSHGQLVTIIPTSNSPLKAGTCCAYLKNGTLVLHRIIFVLRKHAVIAGDNTSHIEKIHKSDIVGCTLSETSTLKRFTIILANFIFLSMKKTCIFNYRIRFFKLLSKVNFSWKTSMKNPRYIRNN